MDPLFSTTIPERPSHKRDLMKTSVVLCCVQKQKVGPVQARAKYEGAMRELLLMTENNGRSSLWAWYYHTCCVVTYWLWMYLNVWWNALIRMQREWGINPQKTQVPLSIWTQDLLSTFPYLLATTYFGNNALTFPTIGRVSGWSEFRNYYDLEVLVQ